MLQGFSITPPVVGRISIGRTVERQGKRLPEKDDQFTVTTLLQGQDGWLPHPLDALLRKGQADAKLRMIPVRVLFNDPGLNLRVSYSLFDRKTGRPMCSGNGERCRRFTGECVETLPCPAPEGCELAKAGCKPFGRLNVRIDEGAEDLHTFIFRTTGFNSLRTLAARLAYYRAVSGDALACLPLALRLRAKTTTLSHRTPFYFADLCLRDGQSLEQAIVAAHEVLARRLAAGFDQVALDAAAQAGFGNGAFEESEEEVPEIVEEFFPEPMPPAGESPAKPNGASVLKKLTEKAAALGVTG